MNGRDVMGKPKRKRRPSVPHWWLLGSDGCWWCKNRNNCNQCKTIKNVSPKKQELQEKERCKLRGDSYEPG